VKLGFVHPSYPQSEGTGATHSASRIVFELADRGHDVTVYPWERPPDDAAIDADISIRPLELSGYRTTQRSSLTTRSGSASPSSPSTTSCTATS